MIAHYTNGNTLTVKRLLGLKRLENVMKYIGLIDFKDDQFEPASATTIEEEKTLIASVTNTSKKGTAFHSGDDQNDSLNTPTKQRSLKGSRINADQHRISLY